MTYLDISLDPRLKQSPGQQPTRGKDENENHSLILSRVTFCMHP